MDPTGIARETGETARTFFTALKDQPLSLALVVMNFVLLGFLFYNGTQISTGRQETVRLLLDWQQKSDQLMANCVSKDVMDAVMRALQEQLRSLRREINGGRDVPHDPPLPVPRPIPRPPEAPLPIPDDQAKQ